MSQRNDDAVLALVNVDAELMVIGGLLKGDPDSFAKAAEILSESSFTIDVHKCIFTAMRDVFNSGGEINYGTVLLALKRLGLQERVVGLVDFVEGIPGIHNLETFCESVAESERLRRLYRAGEAIMERALTRIKSEEIVVEAQALLLQSEYGRRGKRAVRPSEIIERAGGLQSFIQPPLGKRVMTPWRRVNAQTNGLGTGQLWIIGGISGTGKTSMALNLIEEAIFNQRLRVKLVSKEMDAEEVLFNMACTRAKVDSQAVRANRVNAEQRQFLQRAVSDYAVQMDDCFEIEDSECGTCAAIAAALRKNISERRPVDFLVVDFLQLLKGVGRPKDRREEVDQIAYGLKGIARDFRIPVLALSQLNTRKLEAEGGAPRDKNQSKKPAPPSLGDFRESSAIEQSADAAWILRRTDVEQQFHKTQLVDAFLLKQRGGRTGRIPFRFHATYRLFEEIESNYEEVAA